MTAPDRGAGLTAGRRRKWTYAHDGHGAFSIQTDDCDGERICFVRKEAHARLIAAAPEMLAALHSCAQALRMLSSRHFPSDMDALAKADAAIALTESGGEHV